MIVVTKEQLDYLKERGLDISAPLERGELQEVLDVIDDEIVCLIQNDEDRWGVEIGKLQKIWDDIYYASGMQM